MLDHPDIALIRNSISLQKKITTKMICFQSTKCPPHKIHYSIMCMYTYRQYKYTTVLYYHQSFRNNIDAMDHNIGAFGAEKGVVYLEISIQPPHI